MLLDVTRAVTRRLNGATPTGIDRVCDAYVARFQDDALAVLQLRGRGVVLDRTASRRLFALLNAQPFKVRRGFATLLACLPWSLAMRSDIEGALYVNVGHTDLDSTAHRRFVERNALQTIYLLHDLIPLTDPHVTTQRKVRKHRRRVLYALRNASGIVVTSNAVMRDLVRFAETQPLPLPPVVIAHLAGAQLPVPEPTIDTSGHPVFVSLGTIEKRKNHGLLLRAWSQLIEERGDAAPHLVLAGSMGKGSGAVRSQLRNTSRLNSFITIRSGLSDAQIGRLVFGARGVLLPSLAEGFGLPMAEALKLETPVIASDLPCFRELGQGIPTLLDPSDIAGWVRGISDFCENGPDWQRQRDAVQRFGAPTWDDHFATLNNWLEKLPQLGQTRPLYSVDNRQVMTQRQDRELQC